MSLNVKVVLNGDPWWPTSVQEEQKTRCVHCTVPTSVVRQLDSTSKTKALEGYTVHLVFRTIGILSEVHTSALYIVLLCSFIAPVRVCKASSLHIARDTKMSVLDF
jgi:hypothetical protein